MTTEGSTLLSNSQLRHAGGVATPRLEGGGARGVSGERLQLNTGLHRHNLSGDRELKVSEDTNLVLSRNIVLRKDLYLLRMSRKLPQNFVNTFTASASVL